MTITELKKFNKYTDKCDQLSQAKVYETDKEVASSVKKANLSVEKLKTYDEKYSRYIKK